MTDFYEDDEGVDAVRDAWESGDEGITSVPATSTATNTTTYL